MFLSIWDLDSVDNLQAAQHMLLEPEAAIVFVMDIIKSLHKLLYEESQRGMSTGESETRAEQLIYCLEPIHFKERKNCEILYTAIIHKLRKGKHSGSRIWVRWGEVTILHPPPPPFFADGWIAQ